MIRAAIVSILLALAGACAAVPAQECYPGASPECRGLHRG